MGVEETEVVEEEGNTETVEVGMKGIDARSLTYVRESLPCLILFNYNTVLVYVQMSLGELSNLCRHFDLVQSIKNVVKV